MYVAYYNIDIIFTNCLALVINIKNVLKIYDAKTLKGGGGYINIQMKKNANKESNNTPIIPYISWLSM